MSRTENSIKNIKYSISGQIIALISNFITRTVFIKILSAEYLGLSGLFSNILSILSLAELGIGSAIVYSMYKPLARNDRYKLKALMDLYKRAYIFIGLSILVVGTAITPFLEFFIKDMPDIPAVKFYYLLYVINAGLSYFFSYKRSILIADQKKYIDSSYHYLFLCLRNVLQIFILIFTKNFLLYLLIQVLETLTENIVISKRVDNIYPFIKVKDKIRLDDEDKKIIVKNTKAMILHKIGSIIVYGTDNILISKFVGIIEVGLYSNYLLIINILNQLYEIIFQSVTASIGNLAATEDNDKNEFIFNCINFFGYWLYAFSSICLINLINPFIRLWAGREYLFSMQTVLIIVINFYLSGMRKSVLTFRDALGLFWYDRYKPLLESVINLVVSIMLGKYYGITGILLGTMVSTLSTCFWIEPYVLYKYGFHNSIYNYFKKYLKYTIVMIFAGVITWFASSIFASYSIVGFIGKAIICAVVPNIIFLIIYYRTKEFRYLFDKIRPIIFKQIK